MSIIELPCNDVIYMSSFKFPKRDLIWKDSLSFLFNKYLKGMYVYYTALPFWIKIVRFRVTNTPSNFDQIGMFGSNPYLTLIKILLFLDLG